MYQSMINWEKVIAVTNRRLCSNDFLEQIKKICDLGVQAVILREKDLTPKEYERLAEQVLRICEEMDTRCVLHNFPEAAGHLGCKDLHLPLPVLEQIEMKLCIEKSDVLQKKRRIQDLRLQDETYEKCESRGWLGTSVHSLPQALRAEALGATYLTAGHVFVTDCKKGLPPRGIDFLQNICQTVEVPVYGIGGIRPENMDQVLEAGAAGVCMMSQLMKI